MTRVLHINDAAFTAATLLDEAHARGLPWTFLPIATAGQPGVARPVRRVARGAAWAARLAAAAARADLLHVHVGSVVRHTGWVRRPYVLHLHGTDARSHQYEPAMGPVIRRAMEGAAKLLYSTPDLAAHVPGGEFFPAPISGLPQWQPASRPRIVFTSRWSQVKGLPVQLAAVRHLNRMVGGEVELVGLDWGEGAPAAAAAGVRLVRKLPHAEFRELLASAHVAIGQPTGMLAVSELEALGIGVPTAAPLHPVWFADAYPSLPPVLGGTDLGGRQVLPPQDPGAPDAVALSAAQADELGEALAKVAVSALADVAPGGTAAQQRQAWIQTHHGAGPAVDRLIHIYRDVHASSRGGAHSGKSRVGNHEPGERR